MSRIVVGRVMLGIISVLGLAGLVGNVVGGEFHWRGSTINEATSPARFWLVMVVNGAAFAAILICAITGWGLRPLSRKNRTDP